MEPCVKSFFRIFAVAISAVVFSHVASANIVNIDATKYGFNSGSTGVGNNPPVGTVVSLTNYDPWGGAYPVLSFTLGPGVYSWANAAGLPGALYDVYGYRQSVVNGQWTGTNGWAWGFIAVDDATKRVLFESDLQQSSSYSGLKAATQGLNGQFTLQQTTTIDFAVQDYFRADNAGGISLLVSQVPEPGSLSLFCLGLLAVAGVKMSRRRAL